MLCLSTAMGDQIHLAITLRATAISPPDLPLDLPKDEDGPQD